MTKLHISPDVDLPESTVTSTILVLGGKGMGKTNLDAVIAEEVIGARARFSWMDPIGIAWSLQHGANKDEPGLEVVVLGGIHGDIPIDPQAGTLVAELVVDHDVSFVIDISRHPSGKMWSHGEQIRFVTAYMVRLYERQGERRRPILQIFDEIGRFAPQHIPSGAIDIAKCLSAIEQIVELGRNVGIGMLMSTQRNARIAASIRELADAMFAFRTVGPLSLKAVVDWLGEHIEKKRVNEIVEQIRSLPVGQAMLVSPGWLQIERVVPVRKRTTFDASATPTGKGSRAPGKARKPDLAKFRELMSSTIEKQKAEDPRELQKTIATLRRELDTERKRPVQPATPQKPLEVAVLKNGALKNLKKISADWLRASETMLRAEQTANERAAQFRTSAGELAIAIKPVLTELNRITSAPSAASPSVGSRFESSRTDDGAAVRAAARAPLHGAGSPEQGAGTSVGVHTDRPARAGVLRIAVPSAAARTTEGITARQQRFLDAAATLTTLNVKVSRETVSAWLGVHPRGGSVGEELKALEVEGHIRMDRGNIVVTDKGFSVANTVSQEQAIASARDRLSPRQRRIFDIIVDVHPNGISREAIAAQMQIHPRGGSFGEDLGRLRGRGLIEYERGEARARDFLFAGAR